MAADPKKEEKQKDEPDPYFDLIMDESLEKNEYPKAKMEQYKKADHQSVMVRVLNEDLWNKYKDVRSSGPARWTLARAINTGIMYPAAFTGCHAGDKESYDDFKDFFYEVIKLHHTGFDPSKPPALDADHMNPDKIGAVLSDSAKKKIISTRIRIARNLAMFPLNPGGTKETRLEIASFMEQVYKTLDGEFAGTFYRHTTMSDEQRQGLIDDHFLFRGKDKMQAASGYHEYWPIGRGIFHNKDKTFVNWINEGDHIRIISMENGADVIGVFKRLAKGAKLIEDGIRKIVAEKNKDNKDKDKEKKENEDEVFMTHPIFGAVTCCPTNLGTGMRASVHLNLPKLIKNKGFKWIDDEAGKMNCQARGSSGEHSEVIDRIGLSNWRRIGFPEYQLVTDMIKCVNYFCELEDKEK